MRLVSAVFVLLLVLMTSAQCQQTAEDWNSKGVSLAGQGGYDEAIRLDPNDAAAVNNKVNVLKTLGSTPDEAIKKIIIKNSTILLFDASSSMSGDKMKNAKIAVKEFISGLDLASNEVALIVFYDCDNIKIEQPFTTNQSVISSKIDTIQPIDGTPLRMAIDLAKNYIDQSARGINKKIILFTDGSETCPYNTTYKGTEDIKVSVIGFDILKGSIQDKKLQDLAKTIGGDYLNAENASTPEDLGKKINEAYTGTSSANVWNLLGIMRHNQGKYDEAIKAYDEAIKLNSSAPVYWFNKAEALYAQTKYDEAVKAYDEAIKLNSSAPIYWNNKGFTLDRQGKYDEAIMAYDEAIKLNSSAPIYWVNKGNILDRQGKYDEAIMAYDEAIKLNSSAPIYWNNKGNILDLQGKYDEAIMAYDEAIKLNSSEPVYWGNKGNTLDHQGKYDEAVMAYDEAIKLNSSAPVYWFNKGEALYKQVRYDEAVRAYDEAIKLNSSAPVYWNNKGFTLDRQGKYDEAIMAYDEAIKLNSSAPIYWVNKGTTLTRQGKYDEAIMAYDEAIMLDPEYAMAWYGKGNALDRLGKPDEAAKCIEEYLRLNPTMLKSGGSTG